MGANDMIEKLPPQNDEAEVATLGSMLLDHDAISHAIELVTDQSFYKESHRKIFRAIIQLYNDNKAVDIITLTEQLKKEGSLDEVGGPVYISTLASSVPTSANIAHYAKIVKEKAVLRSLINVSTQIASECYDSSRNADELLDKAQQLVFDVSSKKVDARFAQIRDVIKGSIETIDSLYQRKAHVTGLGTGFRELDIRTAGFHPSDLIVIAARPSMGKSALASCIAEHIGVIEKQPVAFFSLEMSKEQLVQRMLCSHARVDAHKVRTGFLSQADWPRLVTAAGKLSEAPIYIDDSGSLSALELRAKARRLKALYDIRLVIVDYLQLMKGAASSSDNRQQEISEISRSLKALARELNVPVIAISQLSRAVEQRENKRPQLSDLRESGAIEQDADLVILLLRREYYERDNPEVKGLAEINIAKQRNGPVGTFDLTFIGEYMRFENLEMAREEDFVDAHADMESA
ncbi:MAG: replicative DNA helicase [Candidatus Omnitrophica bacterium]|nr:replicative DNA helicase [Candidatus Omnitrophota bacterium]